MAFNNDVSHGTPSQESVSGIDRAGTAPRNYGRLADGPAVCAEQDTTKAALGTSGTPGTTSIPTPKNMGEVVTLLRNSQATDTEVVAEAKNRMLQLCSRLSSAQREDSGVVLGLVGGLAGIIALLSGELEGIGSQRNELETKVKSVDSLHANLWTAKKLVDDREAKVQDIKQIYDDCNSRHKVLQQSAVTKAQSDGTQSALDGVIAQQKLEIATLTREIGFHEAEVFALRVQGEALLREDSEWKGLWESERTENDRLHELLKGLRVLINKDPAVLDRRHLRQDHRSDESPVFDPAPSKQDGKEGTGMDVEQLLAEVDTKWASPVHSDSEGEEHDMRIMLRDKRTLEAGSAALTDKKGQA